MSDPELADDGNTMMTRGCRYISTRREREGEFSAVREREGGNFCCFQDLMHLLSLLDPCIMLVTKEARRRMSGKESEKG